MSDWYKMNPLDWNSGTDGLSLEQEAAYLRLCHAMYISDGPIRDNSFILCGLFRCNDRKAKRLLLDLVQSGKILVTDGLISNRRALEVISERDRLKTERRSAGARGGVESGKARAKSLENNDATEANASHNERSKNEADKIVELDKNISTSLRSVDKPQRKRALRMPDDFEPDLEYAMGKGMTIQQATSEASAMRDWSKSSPNGAKLDWPAAWRGWVKRWGERNAFQKPQQDSTLKALDRMIENERPDIFDALKTIDYQDDRNGGSSSLVRLPAHAQRY